MAFTFLILECIAPRSTAQSVQLFPWLPLYICGLSPDLHLWESKSFFWASVLSLQLPRGHLYLRSPQTPLPGYVQNRSHYLSLKQACSLFLFKQTNSNGHITYTDTQGVLLDSFLYSNPPSVFNWLLSMPILCPTYLLNQTSFTHCFISGPNYLWSVLMQWFCTQFPFLSLTSFQSILRDAIRVTRAWKLLKFSI